MLYSPLREAVSPASGKDDRTISKQTRSKIFNALFILGTFGMVVYFAFQSGDITQIGDSLKRVDPWWLLGGFGCFLIHLSMEGGILYVFFRFQQVRVSLKQGIKVGLIGMYYSSITPAATGGQPMQVFSMKKQGIPPGITSSALAVKFFGWQCALLLLGAVAWVTNAGLIERAIGQAGKALVSVGFVLNGLMVVLVILLAISRNLVRALIIFLVKAAHKVRLVKDVQRSSSKWDAALQDFHASVDILTQHPFQFLTLFLLSLVQVTGLMSATYFVYRSFGLNSALYTDILAVQLMLYIAASFTPLPGASGAQEGGFYLFFNSFFPSNIIFAALIIWRFITYYMSIITGFIAVAIDGAGGRKQLEPDAPAADPIKEETP